MKISLDTEEHSLILQAIKQNQFVDHKVHYHCVYSFEISNIILPKHSRHSYKPLLAKGSFRAANLRPYYKFREISRKFLAEKLKVLLLLFYKSNLAISLLGPGLMSDKKQMSFRDNNNLTKTETV